jgi:hypothetical protein
LEEGCFALNQSIIVEQVDGMWPYWLDGSAESTVRNTFTLDSMLLLTGFALTKLHRRTYFLGVVCDEGRAANFIVEGLCPAACMLIDPGIA